MYLSFQAGAVWVQPSDWGPSELGPDSRLLRQLMAPDRCWLSRPGTARREVSQTHWEMRALGKVRGGREIRTDLKTSRSKEEEEGTGGASQEGVPVLSVAGGRRCARCWGQGRLTGQSVALALDGDFAVARCKGARRHTVLTRVPGLSD